MIYTYVIFDSLSRLMKIGVSKDVNKRLKTLSTGNLNLHLVLVIKGNEERFLHKLFKHKRIKGEWFRLDSGDLLDLKELQFEKIII